MSDEDPSSERDEDSFVEIRLGGPGGKRSLQKERTRCSTSKGEFQDHLFSDEVIEDPQGKRFWQQHRGRFSGQSLARAFSWIIIATPAGGWWHKAYSGPLDPAVVLAATLLGNGLSARLSDDPCPRCKKWFIKRRPVQKCCSKRCATAFNNTVGVQSRRAADHERKLDRARAAMKTWKRTERRTDWKVFVSEQAGLTPRFLTRAVNKNELHVPKISKNPEKKGRKT